MTVANALGSNVFNVLIGLGLPYFVVQAARGHPAIVRVCRPCCLAKLLVRRRVSSMSTAVVHLSNRSGACRATVKDQARLSL